MLWLLEELEIEYDMKKFDRPVDSLTKGLDETHVQGHAPQLILADGRVITQTVACLLYLHLTYDKEHRFHRPTGEQDPVREASLLSLGIADIIPQLGKKLLFLVLGFKMPFFLRPFINYLGKTLNELAFDKEVQNSFHVLEAELEDREWFMGGDAPSRVDMTLKVATDLGVQPGLVDLSKWPRVQAWYARCEARPAWKRALEKGGGYNMDWVSRATEKGS